MNVSAIIVTRGDVDLNPVLTSLPEEWEKVVWCNVSAGKIERDWALELEDGTKLVLPAHDLTVCGRYAAIEHASHDLIYVQDDDVIVSDPAQLVLAWDATRRARDLATGEETTPEWLVANMPPEFRHDFYREHCLVGFGAAFHRDAPEEAFASFWTGVTLGTIPAVDTDTFNRTCDVVFTALTPRVLVDVPKTNLAWAEDETRMYRQPTHAEERMRMLELVRQVRDAA